MSPQLSNEGPDFDPAAPFPELVTARDALARGDWPAVVRLFDQLVDPDDRAYAAAVVTDAPGTERHLEAAATAETAEGSGTLARTLYAGRLVVLGWRIRTTYRAKYVSREQFAAFHDHLRHAERILIDVVAVDPANATAWCERLNTARGLELGQSEALRRYQRLAEHAPHHFQAQSRLLQQLCPKWGGSFEKMHTFVREAVRAAPEGSTSGSLVAQAHLEHALELDSDAATREYLGRPEVRHEIHDALRRSAGHPDFLGGYRRFTVHSDFAMVLCLMGDDAAAAPHFQALGGYATERPWEYLGDPAAEFRRCRARALRAVAR